MTNRLRLVTPVLLTFVLVTGVLASPWRYRVSGGPNIVLILSDDQSIDSLPHEPPPMPFLQSRMLDPKDHWIDFTNGFISNPLCCPARATMFTGQYAHNDGVYKNAYGFQLKESSTMATWLSSVGYYTGFFGKYENQYPFGREPYVPPGWDQWAAKFHGGVTTVYYNYELVGNAGVVAQYGDSPGDYMPDVLAQKTVDFINNAPGGRPFFVEYAPTAPHAPWVPAPEHAGAFSGTLIESRPNVNEENVSDKPGWVRRLPKLGALGVEKLSGEQQAEYDALLSMDDAVKSIVDSLKARGVLNDTVIIYLTDNGYSYGSHRWIAKRCEYEECNATPFLVRYPGSIAHQVPFPVSNVDIAPTVAALAGVQPGIPVDGLNLVPILRGKVDTLARPGVLLEWPGDTTIPGYFGIRTEDFLYVEFETGDRELYDVSGVAGEADPYELHNVVSEAKYRSIRTQLSSELEQLKGGPLEWGSIMSPSPSAGAPASPTVSGSAPASAAG